MSSLTRGAQWCAKVDAFFWNRTIKQCTSIKSVFILLLCDTIFPQGINIRTGQISPKIVIIFMANFKKASRLFDVIALSQGLRWAIRKFAFDRAFLSKIIKCSSRVHWWSVHKPNDGETWLDILLMEIGIFWELSSLRSKSHSLNF